MPPNKEQRERLKEWLELADNIHDRSSDFVESVNDLDSDVFHLRQRLFLAREVDQGKAYVRGDIACHLHVSLDAGGHNSHAHDFCIRFEKLHSSRGGSVDDAPISEEIPSVNEGLGGNQQDRVYHSVLIAVGELPEPDEGVEERVYSAEPSVGRLMPINQCPVFRGDFAQGTGLAGRADCELLGRGSGGEGVFGYGELDLLGVAGFLAPAVKAGKLPDQVLQGASKVVERIPGDDAKSPQQMLWRQGCHPKDVVAAFTIKLDAKSCSVAFRPKSGVDLALKGIAVLFCPVELRPDTVEVGLIGHEVEE